MRKEYTVQRLCKVFGVSTSGYYLSLQRQEPIISQRDIYDELAIKALYDKSGGTMGAKNIAGTLRANKKSVVINHKRVARLMKKMNIKSTVRQKKNTKETKSKAAGYIYPNILSRGFSAELPNQKWVMDVTVFKRGKEDIYVSALMDLYDRNPIAVVVGPSSDNEMMEETILKAMKERNLKDLSGVLIHTDQGNVYRSNRYKKIADTLHFTPSMSRKANCWDNAVIESFFSHFKTELPYHHSIKTKLELERAIPRYIKYYKEERSQKLLGYLSPVAFLTKLLKKA